MERMTGKRENSRQEWSIDRDIPMPVTIPTPEAWEWEQEWSIDRDMPIPTLKAWAQDDDNICP